VDNSAKNFRDKKRIFTGLESLTIITPSQWLKNLVNESFLSEYNTRVINNGIDLEVFKPLKKEDSFNKYNLDNKKIDLGVASVWDKRKGLAFFLELSKLFDDSFEIVLVGLEKKVIEQLPSNIRGIERTESLKELVAYYNVADVFVNPTLTDNFPTTNLEALACGTPVITFETGGSPEAVNEKTGQVIRKGNTKELYEGILELTERGKEVYTTNCRARAVQYYNKNDRYLDYLNLYKQLL
jgi:glycosyltransferase involved in cell wall biosynthesis